MRKWKVLAYKMNIKWWEIYLNGKIVFQNHATFLSFFTDSAYTERYMGLPGPDGNWKGYDLSDLSAKAAKFHGKNFFLIHGKFLLIFAFPGQTMTTFRL